MTTTEQEKIFYHSKAYKTTDKSRSILVDYLPGPLAVCLSIYAAAILYILSRHDPILFPGTIGIILSISVARLFAENKARNTWVEIGFIDNYFYVRSAWEVHQHSKLKMYPAAYASESMSESGLMLNYVDRNIKLTDADWGSNLYEIKHHLYIRS
ncbi:MAG: hypothetical protein SGJ04_09930 [Bacteroidota bacterium]|nr:hypothetical protein [Bacteroidota bacterium]